MKYKCQICDKMVDDFASLAHIKAEEYLIELIKKDHPEWKDAKKTCPECIKYYKKLIRNAEI